MKILRSLDDNTFLGYVDSKDMSIHIDSSLTGLDYYIVLGHELAHYYIFRIFGDSKIASYLNMIFDILDSVIGNWSIKQAVWYYKYYRNN